MSRGIETWVTILASTRPTLDVGGSSAYYRREKWRSFSFVVSLA